MKWQWEWKRECTFFIGSSFIEAWTKLKPELGEPLYGVLVTFDGKQTEMWMDKSKLSENAEKMLSRVMNEESFLKQYEKITSSTIKDTVALSREMSQPEDFSDEKLGDYASEYYHIHATGATPVVAIRTLNRIGIQKLREAMQGKVDNVEKTLAMLVSTKRKSLVQQAHEDLIQIAGDKSKITEHTAKYCWIPVGYADEESWTEKDFIKELNTIENPNEELRMIQDACLKHDKEKKELLEKLNFSDSITRLVDVISDFVYHKDNIRAHMNQSFYYSKPLFMEIASRLGVTLADIKRFSGDEIADMLKTKRFNNFESEKRKKAWVFGVDGDKKISLSGPEALKFIEEELKEDISEIKDLIGSPASSGKLEGKVLIIHKPSDYNGEKDFILVTPMTTPELMHIAKNALAIVTDEGGITCHAAIISRELGIPCIVGTKHATKVLKNGDIVYVDTSNRTVQKLSK